MKLYEIKENLTPLLSRSGDPETVEAAKLARSLIDAFESMMLLAGNFNKLGISDVFACLDEEGLELYGKIGKVETMGVRFKGVKE